MAQHPFIPIEDVARCEMIYSQGGQVVENVLHYYFSYGWDVSNQNSFATLLQNWWNVHGKINASQYCLLDRIRITDLSSETAPATEKTIVPQIAGTLTGDPLPQQNAAVAKLTTGLRGRSFRGRIFIPGICESQVTGNTIVSASLTALQAAYDELKFITLGAGAAYLHVASFFHDGVWRTVGVSTEVEAVYVQSQVGSQRRRMPGRGR